MLVYVDAHACQTGKKKTTFFAILVVWLRYWRVGHWGDSPPPKCHAICVVHVHSFYFVFGSHLMQLLTKQDGKKCCAHGV